MSNYKKRYSLRERKADKLWATWQPEEGTSAFWQAYEQLLLRARKAQKNVVISQANASVTSPIKRQAVTNILPFAAKSPLFKARAYILAFTLLFGGMIYVVTNSFSSKASEFVIRKPGLKVEPYSTIPLRETPSVSSWKGFKVPKMYKSQSSGAFLPDKSIIFIYRSAELRRTIKEIEEKLNPHKKVIKRAELLVYENYSAENALALKRLKQNYESVWGSEAQKLRELKYELKQLEGVIYKVDSRYSQVRRQQASNLLNHQRVDAWAKLMHRKQLPDNINEHNRSVYDLGSGKGTVWLFTEGENFMLYRVLYNKGDFFIIKDNTLKLLDAQKTIYKAQIIVYYKGHPVTYTPAKVYYELNGKQHNIAIRNFYKLEKRMVITKYQSLAKE